MYINKIPIRVVSKGALLNEVFLPKTLDNNEFINVLHESGTIVSYVEGDYFNPMYPAWIRATKITIKYAENVIDIEEVFSYSYQRHEDFTNNEGC